MFKYLPKWWNFAKSGHTVSTLDRLPIANIEHLQNLLSVVSVTRLGDLLDFGQVFKAFGNN